jgi:hypothetical protein
LFKPAHSPQRAPHHPRTRGMFNLMVSNPALGELLVGSHYDTVVDGGK